VAPTACAKAGRATVTTVLSMTTIRRLKHKTANAHQRYL
jgi:hypothetical protein